MSQDVDYIVAECHEFASNNNLDFEWESGTLYPYNITVRFVNTKAGYKVKSFKYNDIIHTPEEFVRDIISELTDVWFIETKEESKPNLIGDQYREQLIEQIKAVGQDLIDRAESFVAADLDTIGGFTIEIDIPQDGPVEIVTRMKTYCKSDKYYMLTSDKKGE